MSKSGASAVRRASIALLYAGCAHCVLSTLPWGQPATLLRLLWSLLAILPASLPVAWSEHLRLLLRGLWALSHVLVYVGLPWLLVRLYGISSGDLGLRWADSRRWLWTLAAFGLLLLPGVWLFSRTAIFGAAYPMYRPAHSVVMAPLPWLLALLAMAAHLFAVEFFFRGFLPAMLSPALGRLGTVLTLLLYVATHRFWPEVVASLPFGVLLGYLRQRSGSLWLGWFVHLGLASSLEFLALQQQRFFVK
ncbi:MAG: CPBP family intramembrane metalloprotease [Myxococcales bacterium]|nr:CPBP family intramembrane metalloprotease [Myxococcales bacterium]